MPLLSLIFTAFNLDLGEHSTSTFLLETTKNIWFLNIDKGEYNIAVFLDLQKAFDTVNHEVMLYKFFLYGVKGIDLKRFSSYLENRQWFCAHKNVKSDFRMVTCSMPQGSCLGPLLFLLYVNDLPFVVKNSKPGLYADDTGLTASNSDLQTLQALINEELSEINTWLCTNKLPVSSKLST